jgi:LmbE family N-acetylglucosaminyl deacetylase
VLRQPVFLSYGLLFVNIERNEKAPPPYDRRFFILKGTRMTQVAERTQSITSFNISEGEHILALHAHNDDELLHGAAMLSLQASGAIVHVVIATKGEASNRGNSEFLQAGGRDDESRAALAHYNIPESQQHRLFGLPDSRLNRPDVFRNLTAQIDTISEDTGATKFITLGEQGIGNSDHRAVHEAALIVALLRRRIHENIELYGLTTDHPDVIVKIDEDTRRTKITALAEHDSQFEGIRPPTAGDVIDSGRTTIAGFHLPIETAALLMPYHDLIYSHEAYKRYDLNSSNY